MTSLVAKGLLFLHGVSGGPCKETLVEHYYGANHGQLDDGACYTPPKEVDLHSPSLMQGYFLKEAAEGPDNARCLDGTPALYYHRSGSGSGANKWYVHQQGGGWCYDEIGCVARSKSSLGSTKGDKDTDDMNGGYFSMDPNVNPLMHNWNAVFIRYCDGASLSGDKETPANVSGNLLHYRGRAILDAEIKSLLYDRGMKQATDVVVSGCSAGGLATFLHCDHWADAIKKSNPATVVACMPDSGFFLDEDRAPKYGSKMRNVYHFQQSSPAGLNAACVAAHPSDPEKCIFAQWTSEHIRTPLFPLQSVYDAWQTGNVLEGRASVPIINEFGRNVTELVKSRLLTQPQHGIFLDSCHHHCGAWNGPVIDQMDSSLAMKEWYEKGSTALVNKGFFNQDKAYPCNACCQGTGDSVLITV
eukprot:TRINITY_DN11718_c0_g2_i1.p1 TRINITY_DN11718_c0_g2~~TRINITY_DN11718_c0_g2_i1.p1  ORF type:complete len:415 (-),score=66.56 TRINITY_DN11718_c0_g2_i1:105-1349(-)